jgi:hypothetical protein
MGNGKELLALRMDAKVPGDEEEVRKLTIAG